MFFSYLLNKLLRKVLNPPAIRDSSIDKNARIWDHCTIINSSIGRYSYISDHTTVVYTEIGSFCSISSYCQIGGASHPKEYVSTSPLFYRKHNAFGFCFVENPYVDYHPTVIGNDVWIGTNALIRSGIKVSDGAIIGMGAVVTHDVGPYEIWGGNPARLLGRRFSSDVVEQILKSEWWLWPDHKIREFSPFFNAPNAFLNEISKNNKTV